MNLTARLNAVQRERGRRCVACGGVMVPIPPPRGAMDLFEEAVKAYEGLSDQEKAFIERADKGFGILFTEQGRVPFYNMLTPMEYSYFTTKPEEVRQR